MSKEETRKKIINAAEELFSKNGYDGVSTKMIANIAEITEMTLFNHFAKKELLYKTIVKERYLSIEINSVLSELTYDDMENDLKRITMLVIENFVLNKNILMMRLKEKQSFNNDATFKIEQDPVLKQILPIFEKFAEKRMLQGSSEKSALLFLTALKGMCHLCLLDGKDEQEIKTLINEYVSTICHGLIIK